MRRGEQETEVTPELTGNDALPSEARFGSAGNGVSLHGADLTGYRGEEESDERYEEDPSHPRDIRPDKVGALRGHRDAAANLDDDAGLSARPGHYDQPISREELPSDDPDAAEDDVQAHERARYARTYPTVVR